jgi:predicted acyltransferase
MSSPHTSAAESPPSYRTARLTSLDVFRGLTMIGMLLVNNPGDGNAAYAQLRHSAWHGWTIADLVFPFFLYVVGITTHLSLRARAARGDGDAALRWQIFRRGALLFLIGLLLNWFPFYHYGPVPSYTGSVFLNHVVARLVELRFLGVLQRIGIAYIAAALMSWRVPTRRVAATTAVLLIGYWLALTIVPVPGAGTLGIAVMDQPGMTLAAWVDRTTLDWSRWGLGSHLWSVSRVFDPEGLLSTIPAIATTLIGVLAGRWLAGARTLGERLNGLFVAGAILTFAGLAWSGVLPINKNLWTSSYVLFTAGVACTTLATIAWFVDAQRWTGWTKPFVVFGMNAIVAYVGAELTAVLFDSTIKFRLAGHLRSLHQLAYERALATWLSPALASLGYSVGFVVLWYLILLWLYRRGLFFRI